ncbi:hypothetical protein AB6869_14805 [Rahnella rivi]
MRTGVSFQPVTAGRQPMRVVARWHNVGSAKNGFLAGNVAA